MSEEINPCSFSMKNYLREKNLLGHLKLSDQLSFHWSNWDRTCLVQKEQYKKFNNNLPLVKLNQTLEELKLKPIWFCNKIKIVKSDLHSLYESYLDSRLRLTWFERKNEILFSFEGEQGPYYTVTSMKWIDHEIYSLFVMRKILLEQYTLRSFRLSAAIPIVMKLDNIVNEFDNIVQIHSLSEVGLILKIKDKVFLNKISNSTKIELKIPLDQYLNMESLNISDVFKKLNGKRSTTENNFSSFILESRILNFYGNMNNAKRSSDDGFYIFSRYEDLIPFGHGHELKNIFEPLVEKTKIYLSKDLEEFGPQTLWTKSA